MLAAHDIVERLCFSISAITAPQMSRGWGWSLGHAERVARALVGERLLRKTRISAPPILPLERPLMVFHPRDNDPSFGHLSYAARRRWRAPPIETCAYSASPRAAELFGGGAFPKGASLQLRHELHMTEIFLRFKQMRPNISQLWYRGDIAKQLKMVPSPRVPDAFIFCACGGVEWAIEFIGAYPSSRIRGFHKFCKEREYAYQMW